METEKFIKKQTLIAFVVAASYTVWGACSIIITQLPITKLTAFGASAAVLVGINILMFDLIKIIENRYK